MKFIFGFFGFYREGYKYSYNFDIKHTSYKKYIYSPRTINEDTEQLCNMKHLLHKFGKDTHITLYDYDKQKHLDKCHLYNSDKFINPWYQQGYRIFSFFHHIQQVLQLVKQDKYDPEDIIILARIDIGLTITNEYQLVELLKMNDVIVTSMGDHSVDDKVFIFKYKNIDTFINLYEDYGSYIQKFKNNDHDKPVSTRPEDIFFHHFTVNHLKITTGPVSCEFNHVCSKYCGHHKENTDT